MSSDVNVLAKSSQANEPNLEMGIENLSKIWNLQEFWWLKVSLHFTGKY